MRRKFQCKVVPVSWIEGQEHRLDCGPYMSGAMETREKLRQLSVRKNQLQELTIGGTEGIINAGRITRLWVNDATHGYPFLSSTDILQADLTNIKHIAKSVVRQNHHLLIKKNWILVTRSGSIGGMTYVRSDMNGMACTEDVLRIIPNEAIIKPGYLYAYLSTKYGVPLLISGTYGSIITHLEPSHIADLPVPRLNSIETQVHMLIQQAADLRSNANQILNAVTRDLEKEIGGGQVNWHHNHVQSFAIKATTLNSKVNRLDAFHHIGYVGEAIEKAAVPLIEVQNYARALRPPIMKRIRVEEGGYEFLGGAELLTLDQRGEDRISTRTRNIEQYIVQPGYVLFQCVGQRYGIFGTPVLANRNIIGKAVTEAVMRLIPHDPLDAGYLSVYLATGFGKRLAMRYSAGTSIPVLQEDGANKILVYWPEDGRRHEISRIAEQAWEYRAMATELEDEARFLVERTIEEGGR